MINNVSEGMKDCVSTEFHRGTTSGKQLEDILTIVCNKLGRASVLTEGKADLEFLLGIVASYLLSRHRGKLGEDALPPSILFDERVFPQIDNFQEVEVEEIEDGDSTTDEVVGSEAPKQNTTD